MKATGSSPIPRTGRPLWSIFVLRDGDGRPAPGDCAGLTAEPGSQLTGYVNLRKTPEPAEPQFRRLHPIANNSRIVIPTPGQVLNPASRMPGACLRPPSQDIREGHGYRAPPAEIGDAD